MNAHLHRWTVAIVLVVASLALGACGGTPTLSQPTPDLGATETVTISDFAFHPAKVEIDAGESVAWTNEDPVAHTVSGDDGIESGDLTTGATYTKTFDAPGRYNYMCGIHPSMRGTVIVR